MPDRHHRARPRAGQAADWHWSAGLHCHGSGYEGAIAGVTW